MPLSGGLVSVRTSLQSQGSPCIASGAYNPFTGFIYFSVALSKSA